MSGPKISAYELEQQRRRKLEEEARLKKQRIEAEMRKMQAELDRKRRITD